jgi:membrane-associated protease RseP (regulator of RpoE activity)
VTHFVLAFVALWVVLVFVGVADDSKVESSPTKVGAISPCVTIKWDVDPKTKLQRQCTDGVDPRSPAAQAGLKPGDVITAVNGQPAPTYAEMRTAVRALKDTDATITYTRNGRSVTAPVHIYAVDRLKESVPADKPASEITADDLERAGLLGIGAEAPLVTVGPVEGAGQAVSTMGKLVTLTAKSFQKIPEKIPNLIRSISGGERDPETPVSVVGVSRIGGELISVGAWTQVLSLFAVMNLFFGIFNLLPLLPMDGGHIAIAWFERIRSAIAARRGRPDPGRVDYVKLTPVTLAVISILGVFVLLTVTADIVNPISIFR